MRPYSSLIILLVCAAHVWEGLGRGWLRGAPSWEWRLLCDHQCGDHPQPDQGPLSRGAQFCTFKSLFFNRAGCGYFILKGESICPFILSGLYIAITFNKYKINATLILTCCWFWRHIIEPEVNRIKTKSEWSRVPWVCSSEDLLIGN